jgi:ribosomal protein S18 acetylase RimI-like enzyme
MGAAALVDKLVFNGLRPVNLRTDLAGIADLIELCFGPTMDESGRASLREMRMVAQSQSLSFLYDGIGRMLGGLESGYVWIEDGKVVGNVSISPANTPASLGSGFIIANVAVHPDFRRHGIARELLTASLELIRERRGKFAVLQVDASNEGARHIYDRLGFRAERTFIRWTRSPHARPPAKLPNMPAITLRQPNEWRAEMALADLARPNELGGIGWIRPVHPQYFRWSILRAITDVTMGRNEEHWIIHSDSRREILASLRISMSFGGVDRLELLVNPSRQGQLEEPLLNHALRRLDGRRHALSIEHPADDLYAGRVLERYAFERRYTLTHMRLDF